MIRTYAPIAVACSATAIAAAILGLFGPAWLPPMVRVVAVYDAATISLLVWFWNIVTRSTAAVTKARAAVEDPGRNAVSAIILIAIAFGFVAAFEILGRGPRDSAPHHGTVIYAIGFAAVVLGWLLIHTVFLFHYAHAYYSERNRNPNGDGGLVFPGTPEPSDVDFAYFSFVLGMTFQVSDVQVTGSRLRRDALVHGVISFAYNTAILALVVNVVSGLLH